MRIVVLTNHVPFARVGGDPRVERLVAELRALGHECEAVSMPNPAVGADQAWGSVLAAMCLRVVNCDRVIALTFPAWVVRHENLAVWLPPDLNGGWPMSSDAAHLAEGHEGDEDLDALRSAGLTGLASAAAVFCGSAVMADQLRDSCGLVAPVLQPPDELVVKGPGAQVSMTWATVAGRLAG